MVELLSPAGDLESAKVALYNGCDAIYCAAQKFGARAYAKNLTLDELKELLILAHSLNKKIYVTVNTIIKENELDECISFINELYKLGVDGLILADFSLITYVINNLHGMEAHISTQAGAKCLEDAKFFEELGAKRLVLARENSIEEIKEIKKNSNIDLEIFAHGALCVSYSGGCLMSSLLSLRSGNRGRCSQNCRREYTLLKNGVPMDKKGYYLSMRDLNTSSNLKELIEAGANSLKLEGRMKNPEYVQMITSEYRKKIDNYSYKPESLEKIFHRNYTNGFLFGEDKGKIVDISKRTNEGELVGYVKGKKKNLTLIELIKPLNVKDRIKIQNGNDDYYFTIDEIFKHESNKNYIYLNIYKNMNNNSKIYRMVDSSIDITYDDKYKKGLSFDVYGKINDKLIIKTIIDNKEFIGTSSQLIQEAKSKPIDDETLFRQLKKLNDTSFYLKNINNKLPNNIFITIAGINEARRDLFDKINSYMQHERKLDINNEEITKTNYPKEETKIVAFCKTEEQYKALKDSNIDIIYYKNYGPYVGKLEDIDSDYALIGNYGGIYKYKDKELIADYSFNVINSKAVYELHKQGVKYVTLSYEASFKDLKDIVNQYRIKYGDHPNLEMIVYGKQNLMTLKYCPLRRYGECGKCNQNEYKLKDDIASFEIYHDDNCITHIINEKPLNLIDELDIISPYVNRFRLQFTNEKYDEVIKIVKQFKEKLNGSDKKYFDSNNQTRGYFKREIL